MGLNYDDALDRTSFCPGAASRSIISLVTSTWSCPAILFRAAFYFSKRGTFFQDYFLFFRKVSTRETPLLFLRPLPQASDPIETPSARVSNGDPLGVNGSEPCFQILMEPNHLSRFVCD